MLPQRSAQNWRAWLGHKVMKKAVAILDTTYTEKGTRKRETENKRLSVHSKLVSSFHGNREGKSFHRAGQWSTGNPHECASMQVIWKPREILSNRDSPAETPYGKWRKHSACAFYATPRNNIEGVLSKPFFKGREMLTPCPRQNAKKHFCAWNVRNINKMLLKLKDCWPEKQAGSIWHGQRGLKLSAVRSMDIGLPLLKLRDWSLEYILLNSHRQTALQKLQTVTNGGIISFFIQGDKVINWNGLQCTTHAFHM